jgi:hypothetical protein
VSGLVSGASAEDPVVHHPGCVLFFLKHDNPWHSEHAYYEICHFLWIRGPPLQFSRSWQSVQMAMPA